MDALFAPEGQRPEALVFANDQMAIGALHALEQRGLRVPDDVAVTGFDGIPLSRLVRPALTPCASRCCAWERKRWNCW